MRAFILSSVIVAHTVAFVPIQFSKFQQSLIKQSVATDNALISETLETREEGTMMSSPAFKIIDFVMSIPIIHGWCFF